METEIKELLKKLAAPFPESAIKWRAAVSGLNGKSEPFVLAVPYIDARAIQSRLDDVIGAENWMAEYRQGANNGTMCKLSLRIGGEWIAKEDGADLTEIEPIKGGISNAYRRCAVVWGVGRYLYKLSSMYGVVAENGAYKGSARDRSNNSWVNFRWNAPKLPASALPEMNLKVLPGDKPTAENKAPVKPVPAGKAPQASAAKAEIKIEDVPTSLRELFVELQISDAKGVDLCKRKNYDFAEVERVLNDIRLEPAAVGS